LGKVQLEGSLVFTDKKTENSKKISHFFSIGVVKMKRKLIESNDNEVDKVPSLEEPHGPLKEMMKGTPDEIMEWIDEGWDA